MRKSRYSDEEIVHALRQFEAGVSLTEIIHTLGVSEATFHAWRKRFADCFGPETSELRQLRDENAYLRRLVAHLTVERQRSQDVLVEKW